MLRFCSIEHFCILASIISIISSMAGISTRVSVQTTATSLSRCAAGMDRTASKMSNASKVLSLPPLKPTSQGRASAWYNSRNETLISEMSTGAIRTRSVWTSLRHCNSEQTADFRAWWRADDDGQISMLPTMTTARDKPHWPQPFLRNLYNQTTLLPGDKSPGYFQVIPPGYAKNQATASPTSNLSCARAGPLIRLDNDDAGDVERKSPCVLEISLRPFLSSQ